MKKGRKPMMLVPNNFAHKAGDGLKTRKHHLSELVPSLQAKEGRTQASFVLSDSSISLRGLGASTSDSKGRIKIVGELPTKDVMEKPIYSPEGISPSLMAGGNPNKKTNTHQGTRRIWIQDSSVSGLASGTSTLDRSTGRGFRKHHLKRETFDWSKQTGFQKQTCSVLGFLASRSVLQESGRALRKPEERFFMRFAGLPQPSESRIYSLKMLKDFFRRKTTTPLQKSSVAWMNWGMCCSGRCLTARILAFPRTGSVCSLSDVLEKSVSSKYFLSAKMLKHLMKKIKVKRINQ